MLVLATISLNTKFEITRFSNTMGPQNLKVGLVTPTTPFWQFVTL